MENPFECGIEPPGSISHGVSSCTHIEYDVFQTTLECISALCKEIWSGSLTFQREMIKIFVVSVIEAE